MNIKYFTFLVSFTVSILSSQTVSDERNPMKLTTISFSEMEIPETVEPPVGVEWGIFMLQNWLDQLIRRPPELP